MRCDMWFGTQDYSQWIPTPQSGADVSPSAWGASGTFLNGQGYAINSRVSHKRFNFSWGTTNARETAQLVKSYFDGSFGTGKIYFVDPLTYTTNILPARWASPSITCDYEGPSLVPGVNPTRVPAPYPEALRLPVAAASYDMTGETPIPSDRNVKAVNLFTNPNLVGDGTWAEVRRNRAPIPRAVSSSGSIAWIPFWGTGGAGSLSWHSTWGDSDQPFVQATWTTTPASGATRIAVNASGGAQAAIVAGELVTASALVFGTKPVAVQLEWYTAANTWMSNTIAPYAPAPGVANATRISHSAIAPAGAAFVRVFVHANGAVAGDRLGAGVLMVGAGNFFDGSTMDSTMSQPEDFRVRWLGAENASESVMEIERVRGLTATNCVAGVSTKRGVPAVRLISTAPEASTYTYASIAVPTSARNHGTAIGTSHLDAPLVGPGLSGKLATLRSRDPDPSVPVSNAAGSYPQRVVFGPLTSLYRIELMHGGAQGSGDVWWTDIGLFAGDYTGPAFSGDTGRIEVNGQTLITGWQGTPDNSPSEAYFLEPTGNLSKVREQGLYLPIPPGFQLNLGAFYSATGGSNIWVFPALQGGNPGTVATPLTSLDGTERNLFPDVFTNNPGEVGVYLWFGNLETRSASSLKVSAIHARLSPIGSPPQGERMWVGGQGNEGTRFVGPPTYINNTGRNGGQIEFSATFTESVL